MGSKININTETLYCPLINECLLYRVFREQEADWTFIFTVRTSYERAAPLAEKNAGLSDFSVHGAPRRHVCMHI
jgi:hypothetical protein